MRCFNDWKDDPDRYLDAFVNDDLRALGLPLCHTCACTWRSGVMKCIWEATKGSVCGFLSNNVTKQLCFQQGRLTTVCITQELERCLVERFEAVRSNPRCLEALSM